MERSKEGEKINKVREGTKERAERKIELMAEKENGQRDRDGSKLGGREVREGATGKGREWKEKRGEKGI